MDDRAKILYRWTMVAVGAAELLSWLAFRLGLMVPITSLVIAFVWWLAWRWPKWLSLVSLVELVIGGKGYLFWLDLSGSVSLHIPIRMIVFSVLLVATAVSWYREKRWPWPTRAFMPAAVLLLWVIIMTGWGLAVGHGLSTTYQDANAWGYLLILPCWWFWWRKQPGWQSLILTVLLAGVTTVAIKTWVVQVLFNHLSAPTLETFYRWIRQTGIGEITHLSGPLYRVFFQSHLYLLLGLLLTVSGWLFGRAPRWWLWPMIASGVGLYLSLSRSLWLGVAGGGVVLLYQFLQARRSLSAWRVIWLLPLAIAIWLLSSWAVNFPYVLSPVGAPRPSSAVIARLYSPGSQQAASARANQFRPLIQAIRQQPLTGHGFGTTVRYYSTDPRVKGWRTTFAFELGYLDLWLKFGIIGLGLLSWWVWSIRQNLRRTKWYPWLWGGVIAILVTHLTTPYLNHPLGLGWLALVTVYASDQ